jgi:GT2 family glycosyltransferase
VARLTVAFPTYRADPRLFGEALAAVLGQSFQDFEVIVADDGSSEEALAPARASPRVRVVKNERRRGLAGNWNRCVELAASELVHIAHQDDRMEPGFLARTVEALEKNPAVGLVHTGWRAIDREGRETGERWEHLEKDHRADFVRAGRRYFVRIMEDQTPICCPTAVFRREVFERVGPFDTRFRFAADVEMWFRICLRFDVAYVHDTLFSYRRHEDATTAAFTRAEHYREQLLAKRAGLALAERERAFPRRALRRMRTAVAAECCKCARRVARQAPEFVFPHLGYARTLRPGAIFSQNAVSAALRAAWRLPRARRRRPENEARGG